MTGWAMREYTRIAELRGPLIVVRGVAGVGCTSPECRRTASLGLLASPQNPHNSASAAGGPHKKPTYKTALPGTRRHGC